MLHDTGTKIEQVRIKVNVRRMQTGDSIKMVSTATYVWQPTKGADSDRKMTAQLKTQTRQFW